MGRGLMEALAPNDLSYKIQAWLPNTLYLPVEFPMEDKESAISAARAISHDNSYFRVAVIATRSAKEVASFVNDHAGYSQTTSSNFKDGS
jgi:hypothetical protein